MTGRPGGSLIPFEPLHPAVDGDVIHLDAALGQQLLQVEVAA